MSINSSKSSINLPHGVIVKAPGLLPMLYTVPELAEALRMPQRTLRDWLAHGAPHTRDRSDHIWINGQVFSDWVAGQRRKAPVSRLRPGEGYCIFCRQVVQILRPTRHPSTGRLVYIRGICPQCHGKVTRGARHDPSQ